MEEERMRRLAEAMSGANDDTSEGLSTGVLREREETRGEGLPIFRFNNPFDDGVNLKTAKKWMPGTLGLRNPVIETPLFDAAFAQYVTGGTSMEIQGARMQDGMSYIDIMNDDSTWAPEASEILEVADKYELPDFWMNRLGEARSPEDLERIAQVAATRTQRSRDLRNSRGVGEEATKFLAAMMDPAFIAAGWGTGTIFKVGQASTRMGNALRASGAAVAADAPLETFRTYDDPEATAFQATMAVMASGIFSSVLGGALGRRMSAEEITEMEEQLASIIEQGYDSSVGAKQVGPIFREMDDGTVEPVSAPDQQVPRWSSPSTWFAWGVPAQRMQQSSSPTVRKLASVLSWNPQIKGNQGTTAFELARRITEGTSSFARPYKQAEKAYYAGQKSVFGGTNTEQRREFGRIVWRHINGVEKSTDANVIAAAEALSNMQLEALAYAQSRAYSGGDIEMAKEINTRVHQRLEQEAKAREAEAKGEGEGAPAEAGVRPQEPAEVPEQPDVDTVEVAKQQGPTEVNLERFYEDPASREATVDALIEEALARGIDDVEGISVYVYGAIDNVVMPKHVAAREAAPKKNPYMGRKSFRGAEENRGPKPDTPRKTEAELQALTKAKLAEAYEAEFGYPYSVNTKTTKKDELIRLYLGEYADRSRTAATMNNAERADFAGTASNIPEPKFGLTRGDFKSRIRSHNAVENVEFNEGEIFIDLRQGYEWSGQRSFGTENLREAMALLREVKRSEAARPTTVRVYRGSGPGANTDVDPEGLPGMYTTESLNEARSYSGENISPVTGERLGKDPAELGEVTEYEVTLNNPVRLDQHNKYIGHKYTAKDVEQWKAEGYDGIIMPWEGETGGVLNYLPFYPENIRKIGKAGEQPTRAPEPEDYASIMPKQGELEAKAQAALDNRKPRLGDGSQLRAMIDNANTDAVERRLADAVDDAPRTDVDDAVDQIVDDIIEYDGWDAVRNLVHSPDYLPRRFSVDGIQNLRQNRTEDEIKESLAAAMARANPERFGDDAGKALTAAGHYWETLLDVYIRQDDGPRFAKKTFQDRRAAVEEVNKILKAQGKNPDDIAEEAMELLLEQLAPIQRAVSESNRAKPRMKLDLDSQWSKGLDEIFEQDALDLAMDYSREMAGFAALNRVGFTSVAELDKMISQAAKDLDKGVDIKATADLLDELRFWRDTILGKPSEELAKNPKTSWFASQARRINFAAYMNNVAFAAVSEIAGHAMRVGVFNYMGQFSRYRGYLKRARAGDLSMADDVFETADIVMGHGTGMIRAELAQRTQRYDFDFPETDPGFNRGRDIANAVDTYTRKSANAVSRLSAMAPLQQFMRMTYVSAMVDHLIKRAAKGDLPFSQRRMETMGISPEMWGRISAELNNSGRVVSPDTGREVPMIRHQEWSDREAAEAFINWLDRDSRRMILEGDLGHSPRFLREKPMVSLMFQFLSFPINAWTKHSGYLGQVKDGRAFAEMLVMAAGGMIGVQARTFLQGVGIKDDERRAKFFEERLNPLELAKSSFYYSAHASLLPNVYDTAIGTARSFVGEEILPNELSFSFTRNSGLASSFLTGNPTVATIDRAAKVLPSFFDEDGATKQDVQKAIKLLPFGNHVASIAVSEHLLGMLPEEDVR